MIYQINCPPNARIWLKDIVDLQCEILDIVAGLPAGPLSEMEAFVNEHAGRLVKGERDLPRAKAGLRWLFKIRKGQLWEALSEFSEAPTSEKKRLLDQIRHDIKLLEEPQAERFEFVVPENNKDVWRSMRDFLYIFYDLWRDNGLEAELFSVPIPGDKYWRQDFLTEFEKTHSGLLMCPMCDSMPYRIKTTGHIHSSVDHFFSRDLYPQFSCHPLNLVPMCSPCNSALKGQSNVFASSTRTLADLALPYRPVLTGTSNGGGLGDHIYAEVRTRPEVASSENGSAGQAKDEALHNVRPHPLEITLLPARGADKLREAIDAWNKLYKVEERWNNDLDVIGHQVFRRLRQFLSSDLFIMGALDDINTLSERLRVLIGLIHEYDRQRDPFAFMLVWMLNAYLDDLEKQGTKAPLYTELKSWASEWSSKLTYLKEEAERIRQLVPAPTLPVSDTPRACSKS